MMECGGKQAYVGLLAFGLPGQAWQCVSFRASNFCPLIARNARPRQILRR